MQLRRAGKISGPGAQRQTDNAFPHIAAPLAERATSMLKTAFIVRIIRPIESARLEPALTSKQQDCSVKLMLPTNVKVKAGRSTYRHSGHDRA
jgi:hypothetical protein